MSFLFESANGRCVPRTRNSGLKLVVVYLRRKNPGESMSLCTSDAEFARRRRRCGEQNRCFNPMVVEQVVADAASCGGRGCA